jgi:hypothetical protein
VTEPRIIYVTGMKPKPPPDVHREALLRALKTGLARHRPTAAALLDAPERFTLVSWTHAFYGSERDFELDREGFERLLADPDPAPEDLRDIDSIARRLRRLWHLFGDSLPLLSRFIARPDLRVTMSEVRRYLHDEDGVGQRTRAMLKDVLLAAWRAGEPVMLIAHSLGTVIAYDSLWELSHEAGEHGRVDWLVTLGSPLGTRFIRRSVKGAGRRGPDRYPTGIGRWLNCVARGEVTALRPRLAPFYGGIVTYGGCDALVDRTDIYNPFRDDVGINVHKSYGYLVHEAVANTVADWLEEVCAAPRDES